MEGATLRKQIISELYARYQANGFITEDEALACFVAHQIPLSEIDSISEHLLAVGVLIKYDDDEDDEESYSDRSKLDYEEIYKEVLEIAPGLSTFIEYVRQITPPQHREAQSLIPQVQNGNQYARNRLIEMYLRTAIKQALNNSKRYRLPLEDTIQDGIIGLIIAIEKYDPREHEKVSTYAPWWIGQSISRMRQIPNNPMYFPVHVKDILFPVLEAVYDHTCENGTSDNWELSTSFRDELANKYSGYSYMHHLEQWRSFDAADVDSDEYSDRGLFNEVLFERVDLAITFKKIMVCIDRLKEKERQVLLLRNGIIGSKEKTLEEVGQEFSLTRERVRQIEAKALRKLRKMLGIAEKIPEQEKEDEDEGGD